MPSMKEIYGLKGAVITGVDLIKGLGVCSGCTNIDVPGATAFFDTDYNAKGEYAVNALKDNDIVFVHIEAPDEAGHAKNLKEKVKGIESIDKYILAPLLDALENEYNDFKINSARELVTADKLHFRPVCPRAQALWHYMI